MLKSPAITPALKWWNSGSRSSPELSSSVKNKTCDLHKRRNSWILRVLKSYNSKNSRKRGINTWEKMRRLRSSWTNSWKWNRSKSWCCTKKESPKLSSWNRVTAKVWLKCVSKKRSSSQWRTTTKPMPRAIWSKSRSSTRLKWWTRICKWLSFVKWKNSDRNINRVSRRYSREFREIERSRWSTGKLTLRDSFREIKTFCKTSLRSKPWSRDALSSSSSTPWAREKKNRSPNWRKISRRRRTTRSRTLSCLDCREKVGTWLEQLVRWDRPPHAETHSLPEWATTKTMTALITSEKRNTGWWSTLSAPKCRPCREPTAPNLFSDNPLDHTVAPIQSRSWKSWSKSRKIN